MNSLMEEPKRKSRNVRSYFIGFLLILVGFLYFKNSSRDVIPEAYLPLSIDPLPVHHLPSLIQYQNTPISSHRPSNLQFTLAKNSKFDQPIITIITVTKNPRVIEFEEMKTSLESQSLQNYRWILIDDGTDSKESLRALNQAARDERVQVHKNQGAAGVASARNYGLSIFLESDYVPPYWMMLDDDDILELTCLEKVTWMLHSNQNWDLGGFPFIKFGHENITESRGLHSSKENYFKGNFIPNSAIVRTSALISSGCRYDPQKFDKGGEDWDFWMCLASKGHHGGTLPELLYWYRVNEPSFRRERWGDSFEDGFLALRAKIFSKYPDLSFPGAFPLSVPARSIQLEPINWTAPFISNLDSSTKSILFILPWLYLGGADIGALHMIQIYAEAGYRVTVACTLYQKGLGIELRPDVMKFTHDVFILPSFLRIHDFNPFLKHLIDSRGIKLVIISNSQFGYESLPALAQELPKVEFIDYLHNEAYDGWKSGGYPRYSIISQRYLARTITCSHYLKQWLLDQGHAHASRIGVVKLGIELDDFSPVTISEKVSAKRKLLEVGDEMTVISVVARLDRQKRTLIIPRIASELKKLGQENFIIVLIGDGPLKSGLEFQITQLKVEEQVWSIGSTSTPQSYLKATDIFLLPSLSEGISIAVAEAMAMGLPIITANAGALPEQLDNGRAGILINHTLDDQSDAELYAQEVFGLINSPTRRQELGQKAKELVQTFEWRETLLEMLEETKKASKMNEKELKGLPWPSSYYAGQTLAMEAARETDFGLNYN